MTRRLFWLGAGVVLGIIGYRKLDRVVRTAPKRALVSGAGRLALTRPGGGQRPERASEFLRDVREGMDEYLNRHASQLGNTL